MVGLSLMLKLPWNRKTVNWWFYEIIKSKKLNPDIALFNFKSSCKLKYCRLLHVEITLKK
jgi:hypothetical protein